MSTVTPTLIPRLPAVPSFLPAVPTPHPTPLPPKAGSGGILERRNLRAEFEWLSEEEDEVESKVRLSSSKLVTLAWYTKSCPKWKVGIQSRGFNHLRVIGRLHTRQEERNDVRFSTRLTHNSFRLIILIFPFFLDVLGLRLFQLQLR